MSLSEVCSKSQCWLSVGGGFAGEPQTHCSVQSSHFTAPHHARCFWLWRDISLQRSILLQPFSNTALLFFSPWGRLMSRAWSVPVLKLPAPAGNALLEHTLADWRLNIKTHQTIAELPEVPNIMEFSKLVHMKSVRYTTFCMLFFFLRISWFGVSRSPNLCCAQHQRCAGCISHCDRAQCCSAHAPWSARLR